jgi:hypothetical protein
MINQNHWGAFKDSLARWDLEFPAVMWDRWTELLAFADAVFELGRREAVLMVEAIPPVSARDQAIFGNFLSLTRVSVFGPSGIEDRVLRDVRPELLALRPELDPTSVPHADALSINGPLFLDRDGPVDVSISIDTDLWFPRVVGIHDDSDDGPMRWYDNSALASRHTPRLNRFLGGVRELAAALGATWSHEATGNRNYTEMVNDNGVDLE